MTMSMIKDNIDGIRRRMDAAAEKSGRKGDEVLLIAVTKLHAPDEINEAIDSGITDIGENKVQEILDKYDRVKPVRWHLIGHLQTNKVKYIIDKVSLIHSVDSLHLAKEIDKRAANAGKTMDVLVQVNPEGEETKFGTSMDDAVKLVDDISAECPNVFIKGLMCIAPLAEDPEEVRPVFTEVKALFDRLASETRERVEMRYLSMGMSGDFEVAIEEGANIVRVGTAIFGNRNYRQEEK